MNEQEFFNALPPAHPDWPKWAYDMMPLTFIFYKQSKPKIRKRNIGWKATLAPNGSLTKYTFKRNQVAYKNKRTAEQNSYSFVTVCLTDPNGIGTITRSLKHKGYSRMIAAVYSTPEEVKRVENCWRYLFTKYKYLSEIEEDRGVADPRVAELFERLKKRYPSSCNHQLTLFSS